jgi:arginyl-tRNA synthetase
MAKCTLDQYQIRQVLYSVFDQGEQWGANDIGKGKTVVIVYGSPHLTQSLLFNHFYSLVVGNTLKHICVFLGYTVVSINYIHDWGELFGIFSTSYFQLAHNHYFPHPYITLLAKYAGEHFESSLFDEKQFSDSPLSYLHYLQFENTIDPLAAPTYAWNMERGCVYEEILY